MAYRNYSVAVGKIVDPNGYGDFTSLGAALTAATANETIFMRPGTYTENDTISTSVNIVAYPGDGIEGNVIIKGNMTVSSAITVTFSSIQFLTNSAAIITVSGSAASIVNLVGCNLNMGTTAIVYSSSSASSQVNLYNCTGNISTTSVTPFNMSSAGTLTVIGCNITNTGASTTSTTMSAGKAVFQNNNFQFAVTNSSTNGLTSSYNYYNTATVNTISATIGGSGTNTSNSDIFLAGTSSAVSVGGTVTFTSCQFNSSNTNAITGAGTLTTIACQFTGSSHLNNVTTSTGSGAGSGLTNGVAPAAGQIGERIITSLANGSAVTCTPSGTPVNVVTISLTPGVWDVSCVCAIAQTGAGSGSTSGCSIVTTSGTAGTDGVNSVGGPAPVISVYQVYPTIPSYRLTLSATTTVYLTASASFSTGVWKAYGSLYATRVG